MPEVEMCAGSVFGTWRSHDCTYKASTVAEDGKGYCKRCNPDFKNAKRKHQSALWDARWNVQGLHRDAKKIRTQVFDQVLAYNAMTTLAWHLVDTYIKLQATIALAELRHEELKKVKP